jgi:hypothetical protein
MENNDRCCKTHDQCGRAKWPKYVDIAGDCASHPNYERRHPGTLQPKRNDHHQNRRAYFMKEGHRAFE